MTIVINHCQLEWNQDRGVLYVHDKDTGATVLRICGLKRFTEFCNLKDGMIDITRPERVSYPEDSDTDAI